MPIASASSGMVIPGFARTSSSACRERVPEPRGRPRRPAPLLLAPRRPRRAVAPAAARVPASAPTPASARSAASSRWYSSASGFNSFSRCWISLRFSSKKSAKAVLPLCGV